MTTPTPSKTPRADAGIRVSVYGDVRCDMEVARLLELELNAERATSATLVRDLAAAKEARQLEFEKRMAIVAENCEYKERAQAAEALAAQNAKDADAYKADAEAVRELMNVYNLGGWTDAVAPMKRALLAEKALQAIVTDYVTTDAAEHFHPWLREIVQPIIDKGMAEIAAAIAGEKK